MHDPDEIDAFELAAIEARASSLDVARLVAECRRLRRTLGERPPAGGGECLPEPRPEPSGREGAALRRAEARADAVELDLERAHRLLDLSGVPREVRRPGQRDPVELSLLGRLRLALDEGSDEL